MPLFPFAETQTPPGGTMEAGIEVGDDSNRLTLTTCTVETSRLNGEVTVTISGELDMADADRVGSVLTDAGRSAGSIVRVRLTDLTFADSSAVRALLLGSMAADERGIGFEVVDPHRNVRRLLRVSGLSETFNVGEDESDG